MIFCFRIKKTWNMWEVFNKDCREFRNWLNDIEMFVRDADSFTTVSISKEEIFRFEVKKLWTNFAFSFLNLWCLTLLMFINNVVMLFIIHCILCFILHLIMKFYFTAYSFIHSSHNCFMVLLFIRKCILLVRKKISVLEFFVCEH